MAWRDRPSSPRSEWGGRAARRRHPAPGSNRASSHQPGKKEGFGVKRRQPVMEGVGPPAGDAGQSAHVGHLLVVPAQRMMHVSHHLFAVGGRRYRILDASLGAEAGGPLEAGRDGAPERTTGPLEGVTLAVQAHLLGAWRSS